MPFLFKNIFENTAVQKGTDFCRKPPQYNMAFPGWIHWNIMALASNPVLQIISLFIKSYKMEFEYEGLVHLTVVIWDSCHLYLFEVFLKFFAAYYEYMPFLQESLRNQLLSEKNKLNVEYPFFALFLKKYFSAIDVCEVLLF